MYVHFLYRVNYTISEYNNYYQKVSYSNFINIILYNIIIIIMQVANLLKEVEFIFVPFVNPDGYEVIQY